MNVLICFTIVSQCLKYGRRKRSVELQMDCGVILVLREASGLSPRVETRYPGVPNAHWTDLSPRVVSVPSPVRLSWWAGR
jgi:hypothetical protein